MWLLAMAGVVVLASAVVPQMLARSHQQVPLSVAVAALIVQSGVLILLAVWAGVVFSSPLGLGAPVIEAALSRSDPWLPLKRQLLPAAIGGIATGAILLVAQRASPAELLAVGQTMTIPLSAKVLYGGVVEEVLLRWGLMTTLIWLPWRFVQKKAGPPRTSYVSGAILFAAVSFGAGHLPAAAALLGGKLTMPVVVLIMIGNGVPGVMFGYLYWRYGIEAAMLAHALGHVIFVLATAM
jgi:hypothetical protein